jgi:hypothetical protein
MTGEIRIGYASNFSTRIPAIHPNAPIQRHQPVRYTSKLIALLI